MRQAQGVLAGGRDPRRLPARAGPVQAAEEVPPRRAETGQALSRNSHSPLELTSHLYLSTMNSSSLDPETTPMHPEDFPSRLKQLREERGWTRYRLAKLTGISKEGISNLEREDADPKLSTLRKLAGALD